jgi:hypothetical protein
VEANLLPRTVIFRLYQRKRAHALAGAVQHHLEDPNNLSTTYVLLSRMRLSSSNDVLASAERVIQHIISTYSEPNLPPEQIQSRASKCQDTLREFSNICRAELEAMQNQLR